MSAPVPESIKVGPVVYTIHVGGPEWDQCRLRQETAGLQGAAEPNPAQINLSDDLAPGVLRETLWHETLHAICQVSGYLLDRVKRDDLEENVVRTLCPWLLGVLRDNPALVAYLTDAD